MPGKGRYVAKPDSVAVEWNGMKCPACGAENPEDRIYCSSCSEVMEEARTSGDGIEATRARDHSLNDSAQSIPPSMGPAVPGRSPYLAATCVAMAALMLLIMALVLTVYYYEKVMEPDYGFEEHESLFNVAKAMMYSTMLGDVAVVLALILVIQGKMGEQMRGGEAVRPRPLVLRDIRSLLILALVLISVATVVIICIYEFEPDWSEEAMRILTRSYAYLPRVAWVFAALALLLMADRLRRRND